MVCVSKTKKTSEIYLLQTEEEGQAFLDLCHDLGQKAYKATPSNTPSDDMREKSTEEEIGFKEYVSWK